LSVPVRVGRVLETYRQSDAFSAAKPQPRGKEYTATEGRDTNKDSRAGGI